MNRIRESCDNFDATVLFMLNSIVFEGSLLSRKFQSEDFKRSKCFKQRHIKCLYSVVRVCRILLRVEIAQDVDDC